MVGGKKTYSLSMLIGIVAGSLLQSQTLVVAEDACLAGASNYSKVVWEQHSELIPIQKSNTIRMSGDCNAFEKCCVPWWIKSCATKYRIQYSTEDTNKTYTLKTNKVTCCHGYTQDANGTCISGCPDGMFGTNCTQNCSCPANAYSNCNSTGGKCTCRPGWQGLNCTEECKYGKYGENCDLTCECKNNATCNKSTGCVCTEPGWTGQFCETECMNRTFGINCHNSCNCNGTQTCSPVNGNCTCKPGWTGKSCNTECPAWTYGKDCSHNCTCSRDHSYNCTKELGQCKCHPGSFGNCDEDCPLGTHGKDCAEKCSHCISTKYCDPVNGTCICLGNKGDNCTEACDPGTYGMDCKMPCMCNSSHSNDTCNATTGECHCLKGWTGSTCDTKKLGQRIPDHRSTGEDSTYTIAAIACSVGILTFIVVSCTLFRKRKKSPPQEIESPSSSVVLDNPNYEPADEHLFGEMNTAVGENKRQNDVNLPKENEILVASTVTECPNTSHDNTHEKSVENDFKETEEEEDGIKSQKIEIYNKLNFKHKIAAPSDDYNTFEQVRKLKQNESTDEEDYDVVNHAHNKNKATIKVKGYCTLAEVKQLIKDKESAFDDNDNACSHNVSKQHQRLEGKAIETENNHTRVNLERSMSRTASVTSRSDITDKVNGITIDDDTTNNTEPGSAEEEYAFCEIEDPEIIPENTEDIYDECNLSDLDIEIEGHIKEGGTQSADDLEVKECAIYDECEMSSLSDEGEHVTAKDKVNTIRRESEYTEVADSNINDESKKINTDCESTDLSESAQHSKKRHVHDYEEVVLI